MTKAIPLLFCTIFLSSTVPALAQDAGGAYYQGAQPTQPAYQQGGYPQGYEQAQTDAYRGQANSAYQQPIQPDSSTYARAGLMEQQSASTSPIKPSHEGGMHIRGAVGKIGRTLSRAALPVAGLGAMYMVTRAATTAGYNNSAMGMGNNSMLGRSMMGMPMGGMGMGGYPMMGGYGGYGGMYGNGMMGYPSTTMLNMLPH